MRIAVLSDTHNRFPDRLPGMLERADEIWHLGDVCRPETLSVFEFLGPPLSVVRGNGDFDSEWPLSLSLVREGVHFHLVHIPPLRAPSGCDVLLHGHLHTRRDEIVEGVRWLCPCSITAPRGGSPAGFAWLTVERGAPIGWEYARI